jgi:hypothetical protein
MKNVTISLDEDLLREARVAAARRDLSLSKLVAEMLRRELAQGTSNGKHSPEYQKAMEEYLAQPPFIKRDPRTPWLKREQLYDRPLLRRHERLSLREGADEEYEAGGSQEVD